ncbi:hypothetical protein UFOVP448_2 [uncultured Caudovirales phage]|uniref:Uncharacterized protein n=1 Tax=uncultured Caudovirales phage TaxID=2100421 RepID=A0A6J5M5W4_9CAUD|nr:hypothetical protein UFOVP448_2 [uncultured Caudovirales phage]
MSTAERFRFATPTYFPAAVPWDLLGTMSKKVMRKEFDFELGIHTTYLVGCCLTIADQNKIPLPPPMFQSSNPALGEGRCCEEMSAAIDKILADHSKDNNPTTAGYAAPSMNPMALIAIIQMAIQIMSLLGKPKPE